MRSLSALLLAGLLPLLAWSKPAPPETSINVMSFNLRYATAPDGEDGWEHRKEFVRDVIKAANPDLLGTQEGLVGQLKYLQEQLPSYKFVGVGREDGKEKSEFSAVFIKTATYDVVDSGHYWLSESPKVTGSKSWDSSLPRMVTWVKLSRKDRPAEVLYFANSHWDHRGPKARLESAKVMRTWARENVKDQPLIITGDFNCNEASEPIKHMIAGTLGDPAWIDSFRTVHPTKGPEEASFHDFKGTTQGQRIDFILHTKQFRAVDAAIDRTKRNGRYPSDHYPVTARLILQ